MGRLGDYFPDFVRQIREFRALDEAETPELDALRGVVDAVLDQQFLETAREYGIARLEKMLGMKAKATDTLEERKFSISTKLNSGLPYTWRALEQRLDTLCGINGYERKRQPGEHQVVVRVGLSSRKMLEEVRRLLEEMVPMNMGLSVSILFNRHYEVGPYRHEALGGYSHHAIQERQLSIFVQHQRMRAHIHDKLEPNTHKRIREEVYKN